MTVTPVAPVARVAAGVPTGGQFAPGSRDEAGVTLAAPEVEPAQSIVDTETVFTAKYKTMDDKIAAYRGELNNAIASLASDEVWHSYLNTMAKFHRYSLYNQLLIQAQTDGKATRVAGFNKWKDLGRSVKKGEKGISIFAPRLVNQKDENGNVVRDDNGRAIKRFAGYSTATVFDISQTEGEDLPSLDTQLSVDPPAGFIDDLHASIEAEGYTVRYDDLSGGTQGYTDPRSKEVVILTSLNPAHRAKTLAHELGHIKAGHTDRLEEYHTGEQGCRGEMEVEAESVAYAVCRANGMTTEVSKYSSTYVAGWALAKPEVIHQSADRISKTVKDILGSGRFRHVEA